MRLAILCVALLLASCVSTDAPKCNWHPVSAQLLAEACMDWSPNLMGCQVGATTCDLYVRKP